MIFLSKLGNGYCGTGSGKVQTAAELCHRMVDFCQRLTVAKRKILEDPDLYPEYTRHALPDSDALRLDQKMRRRKVCEKLALVPGKLDHATITAFSVADRTKSLQAYSGKIEIRKGISSLFFHLTIVLSFLYYKMF